MPRVYFVIGVNGVGKSALIPYLESALDKDKFKICDFDARGVPSGADSAWRQSETVHWVQTAKDNQVKGISTVICGYAKPSEIAVAEKQLGIVVLGCLLDASPSAIEERLSRRHESSLSIEEMTRITGKTPEKFVQDSIWISEQFREASSEAGYKIIDTSDLSPEQVAENVIDWIKSKGSSII